MYIQRWAKRFFLGCVTQHFIQMKVMQPRKSPLDNHCTLKGKIHLQQVVAAIDGRVGHFELVLSKFW